jgi:hypothetical protein
MDRQPTGRGLALWRHPPTSDTTGVTRRHIQLGLAGLWLLDAALQYQSFMFTHGFARQIIGPTAHGQPGFVSGPVSLAATLIAAHPVVWDALFATVQLAIGAALLWKRTIRLALAGSILWGLGIWYLGEGLGGVAGGHADLVTGWPGAVALYVLLAAVCWPTPSLGHSWHWLFTGDSNQPPAAWAPVAWAAVWVGGAVYRLLPGQDTAGALSATISGNASGAPTWLAWLDDRIAASVHQIGFPVVVGLFAAEVLIGVLPLFGRRWRIPTVWVALVLLALMWLVGQNLGGIYTGQGTDPNAAAPLALLALALLARFQPNRLGEEGRQEARAQEAPGRPLAA